MKQIMVDFLRRWWGGYLLAVAFVGAMAAAVNLEASLPFVGFFMLPFVFELRRRPVGVVTLLPVSRKAMALSYWCLAVLLPTLLMTGTVALAGLLFHSSAISLKDLVVILFGSLTFAGSGYCLVNFVSPDKGWSDFLVIYSGTLLFCSAMGSKFLDVTTPSPVVYLAAFIGLLLTVWGYGRSQKLLFGRAAKPPAGGRLPVRAPERIPPPKPGLTRFGGVFFDMAWRCFLGGLFSLGLLLLFKVRMGENHIVWAWLFAFCILGSSMLLSGGVRLLRSLPLSVGKLSLILLLLPILSILAMVAALGLFEFVYPGHFFGPHPASFLIPLTGAICIASSLYLPFGEHSNRFTVLPLAVLASFVILDTVSSVSWPGVFWWVLGLFLIVAAFFLNRHWLRSSYSYRPSAGNFLRSHR